MVLSVCAFSPGQDLDRPHSPHRDNPLLRADEGAWAEALSNPLKSQGFMDVAEPGNAPQPGDAEYVESIRSLARVLTFDSSGWTPTAMPECTLTITRRNSHKTSCFS